MICTPNARHVWGAYFYGKKGDKTNQHVLITIESSSVNATTFFPCDNSD